MLAAKDLAICQTIMLHKQRLKLEDLCRLKRNNGGQLWLAITVLIVFMSSRGQMPRIGR